MKDIGARLRELRTKQGLTQQRVAELTGLARTNAIIHLILNTLESKGY